MQTPPQASADNQRLEAIELKLMELEKTVAELNDVVIRQFQEIDGQRRLLGSVQGQLAAMETGEPASTPEPPPPHY